MSGHLIKRWDEPFDRADYPDDAIFFFDFDGVLATQDEEQVFRLRADATERVLLEQMARDYGIEPGLYPGTEYLRHMVFQARAVAMPVTPNVAVMKLAKSLAPGEPFFIITARSARWAVHRLFNFLTTNDLHPQEVFCLGRVAKAQVFAELRCDWPGRPFVYLEDSQSHIAACKALDDPLLDIIEIRWPAYRFRSRNLLTAVMEYTV